ncbi:MAG: hypothetical protein BWZ10_03492 [candidate division BRC1 bacterium ADurb.BinA364]|nr:MAG: hypothetical protein BWZ10_03492 [candidate division BRC1 bacterium ADurb.BinA364]
MRRAHHFGGHELLFVFVVESQHGRFLGLGRGVLDLPREPLGAHMALQIAQRLLLVVRTDAERLEQFLLASLALGRGFELLFRLFGIDGGQIAQRGLAHQCALHDILARPFEQLRFARIGRHILKVPLVLRPQPVRFRLHFLLVDTLVIDKPCHEPSPLQFGLLSELGGESSKALRRAARFDRAMDNMRHAARPICSNLETAFGCRRRDLRAGAKPLFRSIRLDPACGLCRRSTV